MNKRGISQIITAIIMIVLVLGSVGIVWAIVQNILLENSEDIDLDSLKINLNLESVKINNNGTVIVGVKRNVGKADLVGIKFIISDGKNSQSFEEETNLQELETKNFELEYTGFIDSLEISPIIKSNNGKEKIINIVDKKKGINNYNKFSEKNCSELNWGRSGAETAECGGTIGTYDSPGSNWVETRNTCENVGARLCTKAEILANAVAGRTAGYDNRMIWTSSECENFGFYLVKGKPQPTEFYCEEDLSISVTSQILTGNTGVRCCGDN